MDEAAPYRHGRAAQAADGSYIAQSSGSGSAVVEITTVFQQAAPRPVDPAELADARALLAAMPLDGLPAHHEDGLQGSHMPWPLNRHFTGREPDLLNLARRLKQGGSAAVGQSPAVTGLGGQGKTQLAVEFAYRYGR